MLNWRSLCLVLCASQVLAACPGSQGNPCDLDRYLCDDQEETWPDEPICALDGELLLEMGEGDRAFAYLESDLLPELTDGA
ncbi:MAG: hypothetical protein VYE15_00025, partial [Myxococcota bacterium]|nr:hypothetical protein [Myxococcota bacterium]